LITGKTKLVGILGWPVEHSLSPAIHNSAFAVCGLDYTYIPLPTQPESLESAVIGLKALGFSGANVTIPHKVAIMPYLDEIDNNAKIIGAVNTVVIKNGRSIGYNTDAEGFVNALLIKKTKIHNAKVAILGAGGAARAIVCGLLNHGARKIIAGARNDRKAIEFAKSFNDARITGMTWQDNGFGSYLQETDILINSTPLGMYPNLNSQPPVIWETVSKHAVVCDIVYNPYRTMFLTSAAKRGHDIVTGDGMLVEQAAIAFELWTGVKAPRQTMYEIVNKFST